MQSVLLIDAVSLLSNVTVSLELATNEQPSFVVFCVVVRTDIGVIPYNVRVRFWVASSKCFAHEYL